MNATHIDMDEIATDLPDSWCVVCGGDLALLGQLGRRTHFRCICCGTDQSRLDNHDEAW